MSQAAVETPALRNAIEPLVRRLHLVVMGIKADAAEATHAVRSERAKRDMEAGLKEANTLLVQLKTELGSDT